MISKEIEDPSLSLSPRPSTPPAPAAVTHKQLARKAVAAPVPTIGKQIAELTIQNSLTDIDYDLLESWFMSAKKKFTDKDYAGTQQVLQRILTRAKVTYSTRWKWRDEILRMLAVSYCQLDMWEEAGQVLDQDFEGKAKEMEAMATEFCLQDRVNAAKNL